MSVGWKRANSIPPALGPEDRSVQIQGYVYNPTASALPCSVQHLRDDRKEHSSESLPCVRTDQLLLLKHW